MSTLRVNTLQDASGTGQPYMVGAAKAWVNFNGTGVVAIRASFNVSSITDNGTGDYTVNFTNALTDANYSLVFGASAVESGGNSTCKLAIYSNVAVPTTTTARIVYVGSIFADPLYACVSVFR